MSSVFSIKEVQEELRLPRHTINYHIEAYQIPLSGNKFGNQRIFTQEDLKILIEHFSKREMRRND